MPTGAPRLDRHQRGGGKARSAGRTRPVRPGHGAFRPKTAFGFARRHLNADRRWRAPLTEAVFPLYLVHQTVLIGAAVALRPLALPAGVEALVIVGATFAGGFAAWQLARHSGWLRPWLGLAAAPADRLAPGGAARLRRSPRLPRGWLGRGWLGRGWLGRAQRASSDGA